MQSFAIISGANLKSSPCVRIRWIVYFPGEEMIRGLTVKFVTIDPVFTIWYGNRVLAIRIGLGPLTHDTTVQSQTNTHSFRWGFIRSDLPNDFPLAC